MSESPDVRTNASGRYYTNGQSFSPDKWKTVVDLYDKEVESAGKCRSRKLTKVAGVSRSSADKAILHRMTGEPIRMKRGTVVRGVGSRIGLNPEHHAYLYELYKRKPRRPRDSYVSKIRKRYGINISEMFMSRWFKTIGPFKGNLRETSLFPPSKDSPRVSK